MAKPTLYAPGEQQQATPPTLRPHQVAAIEALRSSLAGGKRRPLLAAPTGAGKTVIAGSIIRSALAKGKRVAFVAPALSLIDQTVASFVAQGIPAEEVGVMQGVHELSDHRCAVQVCSLQTLQRRKLPRFDLVLVDEAHAWFKFMGEWMGDPAWANVPFIGLSATPGTKGLGRHYDDLIQTTTIQDLIDQGLLSPFRVFAPSHPDLSGVKTVAGDYHEGQLSEVMRDAVLVADVVDTWLKRGEGRPTLCFAVDRLHAKALQQRFEAAGVATGYIDAFTKREERLEIAGRFKRGELQVVCNVGTLTKGVDWDVRCLILARPTRSKMLYVQIIGRALRTAPGKDHAVILDHSDTTMRLGFVTDIAFPELDDGQTRAKADKDQEPLPKECPACAFLRPPKVPVCPACGFKPEPKSQIQCDDGELIEVTPVRPPTREDKEAWFGMLKRYARNRGYKSGWAANQFRVKFGVWPNAYSAAFERDPSPEVASWIKAQAIRFAKRKEAGL